MHRTQNPTGPAADTDNTPVVTPADTLRGAARYLELHGFNRGHFYALDADNPAFPPACVIGALGMAAHGRLCDPPTSCGLPGDRDFRLAYSHLTGYLVDQGHLITDDEWSTGVSSVGEWNDNDEQAAEAVTAALRAAADDYDWQHATEDDRDLYAYSCFCAETRPTREGFLAWKKAQR